MLHAGDDEHRDSQEEGQVLPQLVGVLGIPIDGDEDADVAQDATGEKCQSALADLALGSGDKEAGDCLVAGDAGGLEDQDEYPGTQ